MIPVARKYTRLFLTLLFCLVMFVIRLGAKALHPFSKELERRSRRNLFRLCAKGVLRITGLRVEVEGAPPGAPFFLVSNHLSFLDIFVLASELGCVFVSKDDLAGYPVFGFMAKNLETIFIDREKMRDAVRVNEEIREVMSTGYGVVVFAESKCSEEAVLLPFKPALLESAVQLQCPVHYASIHYATPEGHPPATEIAVWKGQETIFDHYLNVSSVPHVRVILTFGAEPIMGSDRKTLAQELHAAVAEQFIPMQ